MRAVFEQEHLPPDLAYMAVAESGMRAAETSMAGAAGWWHSGYSGTFRIKS
jgi:hypothetical protein